MSFGQMVGRNTGTGQVVQQYGSGTQGYNSGNHGGFTQPNYGSNGNNFGAPSDQTPSDDLYTATKLRVANDIEQVTLNFSVIHDMSNDINTPKDTPEMRLKLYV